MANETSLRIAEGSLDRAEWMYSYARNVATGREQVSAYLAASVRYKSAARHFRRAGDAARAEECDRARSLSEDAARDAHDSIGVS